MVEIQINDSRGVVGIEYNVVVEDVVCWVEGVVGRPCTIHEPIQFGTFLTVQHASTIRIGIGPIGSSLIFNSVWDAVTVKIIGLDIIGRIVFGIGAVKVFFAVVNSSLVGIKVVVSGRPNVLRAVRDANVNEVTTG